MIRYLRRLRIPVTLLLLALGPTACGRAEDDAGTDVQSVISDVTGYPQNITINNVRYTYCADEGGVCALGLGGKYLSFLKPNSYTFDFAPKSFTDNGPGGTLFALPDWYNVDCTARRFGVGASSLPRACYFTGAMTTSFDGGQVSVGGPTAYGANGRFNFKDVAAGTSCSAATFGDPAPGVRKSCVYFPGIMFFSDLPNPAIPEGGTGNVKPNTPVAYGALGSFTYKILSGSFACNNGTFGDPMPGYTKTCHTLRGSSSQTPDFVANQNETFTARGTTTAIFYGSGLNGNFLGTLGGTSHPLTIPCTDDFFGADPDAGVAKKCWEVPN